MEKIALEIVCEVGQPDLCLGPLEADGADEQPHSILLMSEDMLDGGANTRFGGVVSRIFRTFGSDGSF
jgi:hypothetical protein